MRLLPFLFVFVFTLPNASCQSEYLVLGSGGGFTGVATQYKITKKGKVYKGTGVLGITYTREGKIKKSDARKLLKEADSLSDTTFCHPGNIYYYIQKPGENDTLTYTWGEVHFEVPEPAGMLYKNAMGRIADLTFKPIKETSE